ncbi:unnamed protein product [Caenorhabditis sp. 36 PRJEB53466]|nr:unnamed protein product [Caenorhabditis sp. 36 PRJEB53466]
MGSSFFLFLLLLLSCVCSVSSATCSFSKDNVKSNWKVVNGALQINFENIGISNEQWTGVAFGSEMSSLSVILLLVENNQVSIRTGRTTGYSPPALDAQSVASLQTANLSGRTLNALITVPLTFNGVDLQSCQTWNFVQAGTIVGGGIGQHTSRPDQVNDVCAAQCT